MEIITVCLIIAIAIGIAIRIGLNKLKEKIAEQKHQKKITAIGEAGEKAVNKVLNSLGKDYVNMKTIMLQTKSGSTELDHVVVSPYGIFVLETKNYSGTVYGEEGYKNWKHYDRSGKERGFYSPIKQNIGHIGTLKRAIKQDESAFIPIVVFCGSAEIKVTASTPVVKLDQLSKTIKSYKKKIFSKEQVDSIVKDIKSSNIDSVMARKQHIKHVKSKQKS